MTEQEWLGRRHPDDMVAYVQGHASERKLRLFAVAYFRLGTGEFLLHDEASLFWRLVELADRFADGLLPPNEAQAAVSAAFAQAKTARNSWAPYIGEVLSYFESEANAAARAAARGASGVFLTAMHRQAAGWVRDIMGNPFRPASVEPAWVTPPVLALATEAYTGRHPYEGRLDPECLAVLADALDEAGCDDADILGHLRSPGLHVRGCWALDLVLGKE